MSVDSQESIALGTARAVGLIKRRRAALCDVADELRAWKPTGKARVALGTYKDKEIDTPIIEVTNGKRQRWIRTQVWKVLSALVRSFDPEPEED